MLRKSRERRRSPDGQHAGAFASPAMQAALQLYLPPEDDAREALQREIQAALTNIQQCASRSNISNTGSKL